MQIIDQKSKKRAIFIMSSLPFSLSFYSDISEKGFSSEVVFANQLRYAKEIDKWFKNPDQLESLFRWLIKVGILRREVDGQGLTSRIRLTPLGRHIIDERITILNKKPNCFRIILNKLYLLIITL